MAITTRDELIIAVRSWMESDTNEMPDSRAKEFIALTEDMIAGDLMQPTENAAGGVNRMLTTATGTFTTGSASVSLPSDFLGFKTFYYANSGDNIPLKFYSPELLEQTYPSNTNGAPAGYTIIGANARVKPFPDSGYTYTQVYFAKAPALTDANGTNWILTNYPTAYLYGCSVHADIWKQGGDRTRSTYYPAYEQAVERIRQESNVAQFPSGTLEMSLNVSTP